jgi:hypothetical protein
MWGGGWSKPPPSSLPSEKVPNAHCTEGWVGPRASGIRYPDRLGRSELLYRLRYPSSKFEMVPHTKTNKISLNAQNLKQCASNK